MALGARGALPDDTDKWAEWLIASLGGASIIPMLHPSDPEHDYPFFLMTKYDCIAHSGSQEHHEVIWAVNEAIREQAGRQKTELGS